MIEDWFVIRWCKKRGVTIKPIESNRRYGFQYTASIGETTVSGYDIPDACRALKNVITSNEKRKKAEQRQKRWAGMK